MTAPAGAGATVTATSTTPPAAAAAPPTETTPPADAGSGSNYTAPATQDELNRIIEQRLSRERAKFGGLTPEQVADLKTKAEQAEAASATEVEKREKAAREAAQGEADAKYRPMLAETAFRVAIGDSKPQAEVDEFVADLNLSRFLKDDGSVDTAKVLARVKEFAPSDAGKGGGPKPNPQQGGGGTAAGGKDLGGLSGSDLYDRLHPKKT